MEFILWILEKGHLEIIRKSWYLEFPQNVILK